METFRDGDRVRFTPAGAAKVRSMPEAWGLHRALYAGEMGTVVEFYPADEDTPAQLSVEFPSGAAYGWDAEAFALADPVPVDDRGRQ